MSSENRVTLIAVIVAVIIGIVMQVVFKFPTIVSAVVALFLGIL
ncbi:LapA family protein, partial [Pseudomonas aeruginosa]